MPGSRGQKLLVKQKIGGKLAIEKELKVPGKNARRNRLRRLKRKARGAVAENLGVPEFPGELGGATENPAAELVTNPYRPSLRGNRRMRGSYRAAAYHQLGERGFEFINRHLNPCGEGVTNIENSKIPDGAVPNSAAIGLREVFIVRCPGQPTTGIDINSGAMWTLTVIHTPMFRTPLIMVANTANAEMSLATRALLTNAWNLSDTPIQYPDWESLDDETYWTTVTWSALASIPPPGENGSSTVVSQFRICADGMTIFNNTPDLINQGMVVGAQWNTNQTAKVFKPDFAEDGTIVNLSVGFGAINTSVQTIIMQVVLPAATESGMFNMTGVVDLTAGTGSSTYTATQAFSSNGVGVAVGNILTMNMTSSPFPYAGAATTVTVTLTNTTTTTLIWTLTRVYPAGSTSGQTRSQEYVLLVEGEEITQVTKWDLPPLTTESIIQSTPKAVYMSMKEQNGVYMVKRIFQPVYNMSEASSYRRVRMLDEASTEPPSSFIGGKLDTFDVNYSTGVVIMNSIPYACAPAFKLIRDVECIANADSVWQPFMASNEDPIQPAMDVVHCVAMHHPMLYPESYNILGTLANILGNVVSKIPIIGQVLPAVTNVVKGLLGGGGSPAPSAAEMSGQSQNRLESMNVENMMNIVSSLIERMGLNNG